MNIWEILGIKSGAGIEEIRAAYSEKVKLHHPEDDPDGFMRLREAYKSAIQISSMKPVMAPSPQHAEKLVRPIDTDSKPKTSTFDFTPVDSHKTGQAPEPESAPTPAYDFAALEQSAAARFEQEKQLMDHFIAQATELYKTYRRCRNIREWETLLSLPVLETFKRNEYFTWAFLDFLAMATEVPNKIRKKLLNAFVEDWRSYWQGTALWDEFDVAKQKIESKRLKAAKRILRVQSIIFLLPFVVYAAARILHDSGAIIDSSSARALLLSHYNANIAVYVSACFACAVAFITQIFCKIKVNVKTKRITMGEAYRSGGNLLITFAVISYTILLLLVVDARTQAAQGYHEDIQQIDSGRLFEGVYFINWIREHNKAEDAIRVQMVRGTDMDSVAVVNGGLFVPKGLGFDPAPSQLTSELEGLRQGLDSGLPMFRVTHTRNHWLVVSIVEEP